MLTVMWVANDAKAAVPCFGGSTTQDPFNLVGDFFVCLSFSATDVLLQTSTHVSLRSQKKSGREVFLIDTTIQDYFMVS